MDKTMINELYFELKTALEKDDFLLGLSCLSRFGMNGGLQCDAYWTLEYIRSADRFSGDNLLGLMDIVTGWCAPSARIWVDSFNPDIVERVSLFHVEGFHDMAGRVGLLPGVSHDLIREKQLGQVRQGSFLELIKPDRTRLVSVIAHYYSRLPDHGDKTKQTRYEPIVICAAPELTKAEIMLGTEVRLIRC